MRERAGGGVRQRQRRGDVGAVHVADHDVGQVERRVFGVGLRGAQVGRGRRVVDRRDVDGGSIGRCGEGHGAAVHCADLRSIIAAGLVPSPEGNCAGPRPVEVGVGLEVDAGVGVRRQEPRVVARDCAQRIPAGPVVRRVEPGAVGSIRCGHRNADQRPGVRIGHVVDPPPPGRSTRLDTSVPTAPDGAPASSFTAVRTGLGMAFSTGAVFAATRSAPNSDVSLNAREGRRCSWWRWR